jgi:hypothetical protein
MAMILLSAGAFYYACHQDRWGPAVISGVLLGVALGTKLTAVALFIHFGAWLLFVRPRGWMKAVAGLAVAPFVFVLLWPWLWPDLPARLSEYVTFHARHFNVDVEYFGRIYGGETTAPWHFPVVMIALTLPLPWTLAALSSVAARVRGRLSPLAGFLALGIFANVLLLSLPAATRYGGVRLILSVFPFIVGLGILGLAALFERIESRRLRLGTSVAAAIVLVVTGIVGSVTYYPYCVSYYSPPWGLQGAYRLGMDVTYWGDGFGGARDFMSRPEHAEDTFYASNEWATGVVDALIRGGEIPPQHRMLGQYVTDEIPPEADWVLVDNHPPMWHEAVFPLVDNTDPVETVSRDGTPILWIYPGPGQAPGSDN